jgi:hypothetical protein
VITGVKEVHLSANNGSGSLTMAFAPSNIWASVTLTRFSSRHDDHPTTWWMGAGITQVTTTSGAEDFPFPTGLPSVFRNACTSVTFYVESNLENATGGVKGRATVCFF